MKLGSIIPRIESTVLDEYEMPVENAHVYFQNDLNSGTTTNSAGFFSLPLVNTYNNADKIVLIRYQGKTTAI